MNDAPRIRSLVILGCLTIALTVLFLMLLSAVAHAQGAPPIDPTHPIDAYHSAQSAIEHYGVPFGLMFVVFGVGAWVIKNNDAQHWLNAKLGGRALHLISAAVGIGSATLDALFNGGSWQVVMTLALGAVALLFEKPESAGGVTITPASNQKGAAGYSVMLAIAGATLVAGIVVTVACGPVTKQIASDSVACAKQGGSTLVDALKGDVIKTATSGGSVTARLDALLSDAIADGITDAGGIVVCAAEAAAADLRAAAVKRLGAGSAGTAPEAARAAEIDAWVAQHGGH